MSKKDALNHLRIELKQKIDMLIDEAIRKIEDLVESDNDNEVVALTPLSEELTKPKKVETRSKSLGDDVDDDDSMVLDYSFLLLPSVTTDSKPGQNQVVEPTTKATPVTESIKTKDTSTTPDVLISPVLLNRRGGGSKREHSEVDNQEHQDSLFRFFKRSLSCITPVKSAPPKEIKSVTYNSTPPDFWCLDMPSSPHV